MNGRIPTINQHANITGFLASLSLGSSEEESSYASSLISGWSMKDKMEDINVFEDKENVDPDSILEKEKGKNALCFDK
jgi:hypothetical protein